MLRLNILSIIALSIFLASCKNKPKTDLVISTYDSMMAKGGLGEILFPHFEKICQCSLKIVPAGDSGQMIAKFHLDKQRGANLPHILLGVDQNLFRSVQADVADVFPIPSFLAEETRLINGLVPFDYGYFAFIADTQNLKKLGLKPPTSYADLLKSEWKSKFILEDPRTSPPGLGFLAAAELAFPLGNATKFLSQLNGRWLTMPAGWDEAYGIFLRGEAPLVWSYTTSQAYHEFSGDKSKRYQALIFREGHPIQIEGAVAIKSSNEDPEVLRLTQLFFSTLVSLDIQKEIPRKNWMYPASTEVELPAEFKNLPKPNQILETHKIDIELMLKSWSEVALK